MLDIYLKPEEINESWHEGCVISTNEETVKYYLAKASADNAAKVIIDWIEMQNFQRGFKGIILTPDKWQELKKLTQG